MLNVRRKTGDNVTEAVGRAAADALEMYVKHTHHPN
jgi:hypothetical protein